MQGTALLLLFVVSNVVVLSLLPLSYFFRYLVPVIPVLCLLAGRILDAAMRVHWVVGIVGLAAILFLSPIRDYLYEIALLAVWTALSPASTLTSLGSGRLGGTGVSPVLYEPRARCRCHLTNHEGGFLERYAADPTVPLHRERRWRFHAEPTPVHPRRARGSSAGSY